ncbi:hypothetical protein B0T10DRAFT_554731 [Thelonectria olida]|uniref:C2H2-type domain-containing protein n=1 Tax=Thelonectria olida TaxID=1576542 RepID=A0A9P9ATT3_9HYPO|nr:hypothetical protein B0T10DRAFT_554731 [Thelonectria olida]
MQLDDAAAQGYGQGYSSAESWPSRAAPSYGPSQAEARFDNDRNAHYGYPDTSSHFGYGPRSHREPQSAENYHYGSWPTRRDSGGGLADGTASTSSSPRDDYGYNGESSEIAACHCGKVFRRPSDLAKHQKYHIKYFYCLAPDCEKAFATQKDLTRHARTHRKGEGYRCIVEGCRKAANGHIYSRKDNFDRHMRTAHPTHPNV